jgi:hypothetical protein
VCHAVVAFNRLSLPIMSASIRDIFAALALGTIVCRLTMEIVDGTGADPRAVNAHIGLLERLYRLRLLRMST